MTEHLPECEAYRDECGGGCICHHVRACERRVRIVYAISHVRDEQAADGIAFGNGYAAGLDAAREAVAAVEYLPTNPEKMIRSMALDAIDALKEKR